MDGSRIADLNRLKVVMDDPDETDRHKRQAFRASKRIQRMMTDPVITRERLRLIRAQRADDVAEVEKISESLHAYQLRTYGTN